MKPADISWFFLFLFFNVTKLLKKSLVIVKCFDIFVIVILTY